MFTHHAKTHAEHNRIMLLLIAAMTVAAALAVAVQSKAIADATAGYRASLIAPNQNSCSRECASAERACRLDGCASFRVCLQRCTSRR